MAAYWTGAAHPRRQKHREMPPPSASAPAFAATVKPARARSSPPHAKPCFGARWNACRGMCYFRHRFLISSPDLRIDASFSLETSFCLHRFLISSPDLRIDARFRMQNSYYQRCPRPIPIFVAQRRMARLQWLWRQRVPHSILIFAAAKKNGPPAAWSWDAGRDRMPRRRHNPK